MGERRKKWPEGGTGGFSSLVRFYFSFWMVNMLVFMLLLVSKLTEAFYILPCIWYSARWKQNKTKAVGQIKLRLSAEQKSWGYVTPHRGPQAEEPGTVSLTRQHCLPGSSLQRRVLSDTPWLQPDPPRPGKEKKGAFSFTLFPFVLMRLPVWVNCFVQGHTATEGSQSTVHFTYYYAEFYFILPGRASEKRILKGYSN